MKRMQKNCKMRQCTPHANMSASLFQRGTQTWLDIKYINDRDNTESRKLRVQNLQTHTFGLLVSDGRGFTIGVP